MICRCEPANNVFLGIDRWVLGLSVCTGTVGEASYFGAEIGVAEEGDGLASRGDGLSLADLFGRRRNNAMQSRTEDIVTPAGEQVSDVDDNGIGNGRRGMEDLVMRVLYFQSPNRILEEKCHGTVITVSPCSGLSLFVKDRSRNWRVREQAQIVTLVRDFGVEIRLLEVQSKCYRPHH